MIKAQHQDLIERAILLWEFAGADATLVATRENIVYRLDHGEKRYALRLHRPGYRDDNELEAELDWMAALNRAGMNTPQPCLSRDGHLIHRINDIAVDVLTWLDGTPMRQDGQMREDLTITEVYFQLGQATAKLHDVSDQWQIPKNFKRASWDVEGLLGDTPLWGRFWENPRLNGNQAQIMRSFRDRATKTLKASHLEDYGLIHADLVPDNILINHCKQAYDLHLIDFDDGGFGFRLFDLATILHHAAREDRYENNRDALLSGYVGRRPINLDLLPLFQALRAVSYVGWIMPRLAEDGGEKRLRRFIDEALFWIEKA